MRRYRMFFWMAPAFALMLSFAGNAVAGPNADAVVTLDIVTDMMMNQTDDGVTSATVADSGTTIEIEVFVSGVTTALAAAGFEFDTLMVDDGMMMDDGMDGGMDDGMDGGMDDGMDGGMDDGMMRARVIPDIVKVTGQESEWEASLPAGDRGIYWAQLLDPPVTVPESGYLGTLILETQTDVTGMAFNLGVLGVGLVPTTGLADTDTIAVSTVLRFNAVPHVMIPHDAMAGVAVPQGGTSEPVKVSVDGFAEGATLTWHVEVTGMGADVEVLDSEMMMMEGNMFESTSTSLYIKATDAGGDASVEVWAESGGVESDRATIMFSRQQPVELASFAGALVDDRVVLNWTTASQTNNAGWRVLRSVDGETYEQVGEFVKGAGTSDALKDYAFRDGELPSAEKVFYVLEQIDLDGTVRRSDRVEMLLGARFLVPAPTQFAVGAYPNPFNPSTTLTYDLPSDEMVSIVIYDAIGQEVRRLVSAQRSAGRYTVQWDARDSQGHSVGSGVYIAKIEAGSFSASQKMLLLK